MPPEAAGMKDFVAALLAEGGALVEPIEPEGIEVLAPPVLQKALGVGEFARFGFGASLPDGAQRIGIESDWLRRFAQVVGERGRWNRRTLSPAARKLPDAEALLARELLLDNATFRLLDASAAWTRYLVLDFRFTALADEKREGTLRLGLNLATGAMVDGMFDRLEPRAGADEDAPADEAPDDSLPADWPPARVVERIRRALPWRAERALSPFVTGLQRRLGRDLDRLHAFHNDLHREAAQRAAQAPAGHAAHQREALRMAAIGQEYRARVDDLAHKYALRVGVEWVQTQELVMPVHRLTVQIRRRKAERVIALDWNFSARRLEPPPCEATWSIERPRLACDDAVHLVAPVGLAPCAGCERVYCRACHPEHCPKCGHAGGLAAFRAVLEVAAKQAA